LPADATRITPIEFAYAMARCSSADPCRMLKLMPITFAP
jgi:hypothetical protein